MGYPPLAENLLLFAASFALHLLHFRLLRPVRVFWALILDFAVIPAAATAFLHPAPGLGFYAALVLAYAFVFSAFQADSPSVLIVHRVNDAEDEGLDEAALRAELDDRRLFDPRLEDALRGGLIVEEDGRLTLSLRGRLFAALFKLQRTLLGQEKGG